MKNLIALTFILLAVMWVPKTHAQTCSLTGYNYLNGCHLNNSSVGAAASYLYSAVQASFEGTCFSTGGSYVFGRQPDGQGRYCSLDPSVNECPTGQEYNSSGNCITPAPPPCNSTPGDTGQFSGTGGSIPSSVCLETDNCSYSLSGVGMILPSGHWYSSGTTAGGVCDAGETTIDAVANVTSPGFSDTPSLNCITDDTGDEVCEGDITDSYNGEDLPNGELPDNSCEYVGGDYVCDETVTSVGDHPIIEGENGSFDREVIDDYRDLAPGTGIDVNGDGITDAIARDFNSDGITDEITNADGTTFVADNADGTAGDPTGDESSINDDGSPNYPEAQAHGEEDGYGQGTGTCEDDPGTTEDECGDINKSGASTPYCDVEPTCEGDVLACANLFQNWQILCASAPAEYHTESLDDFQEGIDDGKAFYDPQTDDYDFGVFDFNTLATGWGYTQTCPSDISIAVSFINLTVPLSDYCGLFEILRYLILLASSFISARIFFGGYQ